jgi:hypothetical protein
VHNAVEFEKRGRPATVVITSAFRNALEVQFKGKGMPGHACIVLPHPVYYLTREELAAITKRHAAEVVRQLTSASDNRDAR